MNKIFKEIFEGFNKAQNIARQISKANDPILQETEEEKEEELDTYTKAREMINKINANN